MLRMRMRGHLRTLAQATGSHHRSLVLIGAGDGLGPVSVCESRHLGVAFR